MQLHTVKSSPLTDTSLAQCLNYLGERAGLLLMQDAVTAAIDGHPWRSRLAQLADKHKLYVLQEDLVARGIPDRVSAPFEVIDSARFVSLCLEYDAVQSW